PPLAGVGLLEPFHVTRMERFFICFELLFLLYHGSRLCKESDKIFLCLSDRRSIKTALFFHRISTIKLHKKLCALCKFTCNFNIATLTRNNAMCHCQPDSDTFFTCLLPFIKSLKYIWEIFFTNAFATIRYNDLCK